MGFGPCARAVLCILGLVQIRIFYGSSSTVFLERTKNGDKAPDSYSGKWLYKSNSVSIDVIDVSTLSEIAPEDYDAILLIHTWEYGKPPESVQSFMDKNSDFKGKMVVMTTSGEGSEKMKNIDAISGESILKDSPVIVAKIIARLNPLLTTEKWHVYPLKFKFP